MNIQYPVRRAIFKSRPNRFQAYVYIDSVLTMVHVPNTGRCREILVEGCTVVLREGRGEKRKTPYDLIGAYKGDMFINIDSQIPNAVVAEALNNFAIAPLSSYKIIKREQTFLNSRFDFYIKEREEQEKGYYLEVKGVTFEENGIASFPDAPTERGARHLRELIEAKKEGFNAGVLFLLQMNGLRLFTPYEKMDAPFAKALRDAKAMGVDVFVYDCILGEDFITLNKDIPYKL